MFYLTAFNAYDVLFIQVPTAIAGTSAPRYWSTSLYTLIICLGLSTQIIFAKTVVDGITDLLPDHRWKKYNLLIVCLGTFLFSIPLCTPFGPDLFLPFTLNAITWLALLTLLEVASVAYFYDFDQLVDDLRCMVGYRSLLNSKIFITWLKIHLKFLLPFLLFLYCVVTTVGLYSVKKDFLIPSWARIVEQFVPLVPLTPLFVVPAILFIQDQQGTVKERLRRLITPTSDWRRQPEQIVLHADSIQFKNRIKELLSHKQKLRKKEASNS